MDNPPRVYVCLGTPAEHLEELKDVAAGALWTKWTINKGAVEGDQVVFYMLKPLSAFVAAGIVEDAPRLEDDESSGWYGHYMTDISGVQMLPWLVPIPQARTRFPQWGWLRQPRQSTLVPSDFTNELLGFLRASTPPSPPAGESDIEGTKTEIVQSKTKRSRRLRDLAFEAAAGVCNVCERDFSEVLGGRGVRVLQVHHRKQLSNRVSPAITKLSDLVVVCANCHLLLHLDPENALSVQKLKKMIRADKGTKAQ